MAPAPAPGDECTVGTVAAVVEQRPRWRCRHGHDAGPVLTAARVHDEVVALVAMARRRRLRGDDRCANCGAALTMPARRTVWPLTLTDPDGTVAVTLTLDLPATRCPDCGRDQVPARSVDDVLTTTERLFADG
ncbi:hypothetical protein [Egicoccus halophilus]|uniref:hypothetical protein n=1 Tax=Egicoccus halophilus TaxID=1670830 RepID=UPI00102F7CBB|nr:hypothetical protein [Egicoccus halophilus]